VRIASRFLILLASVGSHLPVRAADAPPKPIKDKKLEEADKVVNNLLSLISSPEKK